MDSKKTLEIKFVDENDKTLNFSLKNPKENIQKQELVNLEQAMVSNNVFIGPSGNLKGFGSAYYREIQITDLLK